MKEKVATRMAAHDRTKNMWVLPAFNTEANMLPVSVRSRFKVTVKQHFNNVLF